MRKSAYYLGLLLGGTILGASLFALPARAQIPPSLETPGPGNAGNPETDLAASSIFHDPAPNTPQPADVNPAHLPDIDELPADQLPQAVVQESAHPKAEDWPAYGRDDAASRFSPLTQITPLNASQLQRAFVYHTGSLPPKGKPNKWAAETTPIKVGDSLYLCSATNDMSGWMLRPGRRNGTSMLMRATMPSPIPQPVRR